MIKQLQDTVKAYLQASEWFDGVDIITRREGDLLSFINEKISELKFFVLVLTPYGQRVSKPRDRAVIRQHIAVHFIENVLVNDNPSDPLSLKHAEDAVEPGWRALDNKPNRFVPNTDDIGGNALQVTGYELVPDEGGLTIYKIDVTTQYTLPCNL